jgi:enamine deaminase RidA (YjgF/YER057c/UK114 family)
VSPEDYLSSLGYRLAAAPQAAAKYEPVVVCGELAYVSGCLPIDADGRISQGTLGVTLDVAAGQAAARLCAANVLRALYAHLGSFQSVQRLVRLGGYVASAPDFSETHLVLNGASEVFIEVLGDAGRHSRSAMGVASLPLGACVEIDAMVQLAPTGKFS